MRFYRLATEDDFKKPFTYRLDFFDKSLPREVEQLIEEGHFNKAVSELKQEIGLGLLDCKRYCEQYRAFAQAKKDFYNGIPVYTDY